MFLSAAYAQRARTVSAAVLNGVSRLASGSACISARLSGSDEKVKVSRLLPMDRAVVLTACWAVLFSLSKILMGHLSFI